MVNFGFLSRTLSRSSVRMIFSFLPSLKTCKTSEVMIISSSNVPFNTHHSDDRRTVLVTPRQGCVSEFLIATHVLPTTNYTPGCSISPVFFSSSSQSEFSFCLFLDERVLRFDPEGDFERQRRLALKIHYDNINTESISMAPAHSILFWVDGISAEGIKKFTNLRIEAVTWIFFVCTFDGLAGHRYLTIQDCPPFNGSSTGGPSCSRWFPL